jgi:hypothetical protein
LLDSYKIGGRFAEGGILDVLADHPGALLVAAAEEIAAVVSVGRGLPSV